MRDGKLIALLVLLIVLTLGHDLDHMIRGDIRWQLLPAVIILAKYAFLGFGLFFYMKGKVGPLFWAIAAGTSATMNRAWLFG